MKKETKNQTNNNENYFSDFLICQQIYEMANKVYAAAGLGDKQESGKKSIKTLDGVLDAIRYVPLNIPPEFLIENCRYVPEFSIFENSSKFDEKGQKITEKIEVKKGNSYVADFGNYSFNIQRIFDFLKHHLKFIPANERAQFTDFSTEKTDFYFISECKEMAQYVGHDELRPNMMGVYFDFANGCKCATDAHILKVAKIEKSDRENVIIDPKNGMIKEGKFPMYEAVIPTKGARIELGNDFWKTFKSVPKSMLNTSNYQLRLDFSKNGNYFRGEDLDFSNKLEVPFNAGYSYDCDFSIGFNHVFLSKIAKEKPNYMYVSAPNRAVVFTSDNNDNILLLMPVMLDGYWSDLKVPFSDSAFVEIPQLAKYDIVNYHNEKERKEKEEAQAYKDAENYLHTELKKLYITYKLEKEKERFYNIIIFDENYEKIVDNIITETKELFKDKISIYIYSEVRTIDLVAEARERRDAMRHVRRCELSQRNAPVFSYFEDSNFEYYLGLIRFLSVKSKGDDYYFCYYENANSAYIDYTKRCDFYLELINSHFPATEPHTETQYVEPCEVLETSECGNNVEKVMFNLLNSNNLQTTANHIVSFIEKGEFEKKYGLFVNCRVDISDKKWLGRVAFAKNVSDIKRLPIIIQQQIILIVCNNDDCNIYEGMNNEPIPIVVIDFPIINDFQKIEQPQTAQTAQKCEITPINYQKLYEDSQKELSEANEKLSNIQKLLNGENVPFRIEYKPPVEDVKIYPHHNYTTNADGTTTDVTEYVDSYKRASGKRMKIDKQKAIIDFFEDKEVTFDENGVTIDGKTHKSIDYVYRFIVQGKPLPKHKRRTKEEMQAAHDAKEAELNREVPYQIIVDGEVVKSNIPICTTSGSLEDVGKKEFVIYVESGGEEDAPAFSSYEDAIKYINDNHFEFYDDEVLDDYLVMHVKEKEINEQQIQIECDCCNKFMFHDENMLTSGGDSDVFTCEHCGKEYTRIQLFEIYVSNLETVTY